MKYLLDTHTLIWFLFSDTKLPDKIRNLILDETDVYVNIISIWEIAIKMRIKKLNIQYTPLDIMGLCDNESLQLLNIAIWHVNETLNLPLIHRDPFDRMLIAQAKVEDMTLITCDQYIPQYPIKTVW